MISYQQNRPLVRHCLDVLKAIDIHDVVRCQVNPACAENLLTPRPEAFPATLVHACDETKGEALEAREDGNLLTFWLGDLREVLRYTSTRDFAFIDMAVARHFRICSSNLWHRSFPRDPSSEKLNCPEGTSDNSPPIHRWVNDTINSES